MRAEDDDEDDDGLGGDVGTVTTITEYDKPRKRHVPKVMVRPGFQAPARAYLSRTEIERRVKGY